MICALCGGSVEPKQVEEEVRSKGRHILVTVDAEVCSDCSEQYFSAAVVDGLIKVKESADKGELPMTEIGKVYRASA